jgi:hypothetical protein
MNSRENKQARALAALNAEDRVRLERLAALTDLAPDEIWPEVWQYGFDDVEDSIDAKQEAEEYFQTNTGIDHAEVMARARALVAAYGRPTRETG